MTTVVVPVAPPRAGLVLPRVADDSPLTPAETADLYAAMVRDVCRAAERGAGDLLVNYLPDDLLPDAHRTDESAEDAVRATVSEALADPDEARFEEQAGSTVSARVGNTVTHLLEREGDSSVLVLNPVAPTVDRTVIDEAAMKLRRRDLVLGPASRGRVHLGAFAAPVDFEDAYAARPLERLTARGREADLDVDYVGMHPLVETAADLGTLTSVLRARSTAGRLVPERTMAAVEDVGLTTDGEDLRVT